MVNRKVARHVREWERTIKMMCERMRKKVSSLCKYRLHVRMLTCRMICLIKSNVLFDQCFSLFSFNVFVSLLLVGYCWGAMSSFILYRLVSHIYTYIYIDTFYARRLVLYWWSARLFRSKCIYLSVYCSLKGKPSNEQQKYLFDWMISVCSYFLFHSHCRFSCNVLCIHFHICNIPLVCAVVQVVCWCWCWLAECLYINIYLFFHFLLNDKT